MPVIKPMMLSKMAAVCFFAVYLCSCSMFYTNSVKTVANDTAEQPLFASPAPTTESSIINSDHSFLSSVKTALKKNKDTVGWLFIPGSDIDNSVLQSFDNSFYIRRDEQRNDSIYGCYFADCDSAVGTTEEFGRNTIIYGHSDLKDNPDGKRFSQLFKFASADFVAQTPNIYFSTAEEDLVWRVFAVFYSNVSFKYINAEPSDTQFSRILEKAKEGSLYNFDVDVTGTDKILTLSTCSVKHGTNGDFRFVVMARMLRDGENYTDKFKIPEPNPNSKLVE